MKRLPYLLLIFVFSLLSVISYLPAIQRLSYAKILFCAGQVGLGVSIILYFVIINIKKPRPK